MATYHHQEEIDTADLTSSLCACGCMRNKTRRSSIGELKKKREKVRLARLEKKRLEQLERERRQQSGKKK